MPRPKQLRPPKPHERAWGQGTVKEVRPGVFRAWRARIHRPDGTTTRPSRTFVGAEAEQRATLWARGDPEPARMYLGQWLERWLALRRRSLAPNTLDMYRRHVVACGELLVQPIDALTVDDWQKLTDGLLDRWSHYHVMIWRGNISTGLRAAIKRGYLASNPLADVVLPKQQDEPPKAWRQDEFDRLLGVADGVHGVWLEFSLGTGIRLGESRDLEWSNVDLVNKRAWINGSRDNRTDEHGPTKTRRGRWVDIPDPTIPRLVWLAAQQPPGQVLVFGRGKRPYPSRTYRRWLEVRCRRAGVTVLPPKSTRHTFVSLALDAGTPIQDVARAVGHARITTTMRIYSHFIGDGLRRTANALGEALTHRFSGPKRGRRARIGTREAR